MFKTIEDIRQIAEDYYDVNERINKIMYLYGYKNIIINSWSIYSNPNLYNKSIYVDRITVEYENFYDDPATTYEFEFPAEYLLKSDEEIKAILKQQEEEEKRKAQEEKERKKEEARKKKEAKERALYEKLKQKFESS